jgi:hypothetical protein
MSDCGRTSKDSLGMLRVGTLVSLCPGTEVADVCGRCVSLWLSSYHADALRRSARLYRDYFYPKPCEKLLDLEKPLFILAA